MKERLSSRNRVIGQILYFFSLIFLIFGLFCLAWVVWPAPRDAVSTTIPEGVLPGAPPGKDYASLGKYSLNISWPRWQRLGEGYQNITLFLDEPTQEDGDDQENRAVQVVIAEANLAGLPIEPTGRIQHTLGPGQDMTISWAVPGIQVGKFPGEVIFSFGFFEEDSAEMIAVPVAVVDVQVKVISLFGLRHQMVLWFGFIGLVFWGVFFVLGRWVKTKND
jgi:hypothetical protein